jgi:hypothetical protein
LGSDFDTTWLPLAQLPPMVVRPGGSNNARLALQPEGWFMPG